MRGLFRSVIRLITTTALFNLTLALTALAAPAGSGSSQLQKLDAIVARAPDLATFLSRGDWIEEYYEALKDYFGADRIPRESFDAVLHQLGDMTKRVPGLAERLWETENLGKPFSVQATMTTFGREVKREAWDSHMESYRAQLNRGAKRLLNQSEEARENEIERLQATIRNRERALSVEGLGRSARRQAEGAHFAEIRSSTEVQELAQHYAHEILASERIKDLLQSGDADLVFDTLNRLRDNPRQFLSDGQDVPGSVITELKNLIPDTKRLLADKKIFPEKTRKVRSGRLVPVGGGGAVQYDFVPVPRRFHGIWKGIPLGECVGGNCKSLEWLTPERWATVALKDAQLHFLEANGDYGGFVQAVPGHVENRVVASVDFGAPDLRKRIFVRDPSTGSPRATTLYRQWFDGAMANKPSEWEGYAISASNDINNAGVLNTVRNSATYFFGDELLGLRPRGGLVFGDGMARATQSFRFLEDPLTPSLIAQSPRHVPYAGAMILDATTPNAREQRSLTLLKPVSEDLLNDRAALSALLRDPNPDNAARFIYGPSGHGFWEALEKEDFLSVAKTVLLYGRKPEALGHTGHFPTALRPYLRDPDAKVRAMAIKLKESFWPPDYYQDQPELLRETTARIAEGRYDEIIEDYIKYHVQTDWNCVQLAEIVRDCGIRDPKFYERLIQALLSKRPEERNAGLAIFQKISWSQWPQKELWLKAIPRLNKTQEGHQVLRLLGQVFPEESIRPGLVSRCLVWFQGLVR